MVITSGFVPFASLANSYKRPHLSSSSREYLWKYVENGWHGAQPARIFTLALPNRAFSSRAEILLTSRSRNLALLLVSYGKRHAGSMSIHATTGSPSNAKP